MAARVFLLSILFTEVLRPACLAGVRGVNVRVRGLNTSKTEILELERSGGLGIRLETEPSGNVVVGRKGVTLRCSAGANQNVSWYRNGVAAPPCGSVGCMQKPNGSLRFFKMVQKHGGRGKKNSSNDTFQNPDSYRCVAKNAIGSLRSSPALLQVADLSQEFNESPQDVIVQEGEVAKLSCLIRSIPFPPNVTWEHDGKPLSSDSKMKYFVISPGVLYINATKLSDAGSYRCIATNDFLRKNKTSKEANLRVVQNPEVIKTDIAISLFPQISYYYRLVIGSDLTLVCVSSGFPISVSWTFISKSEGKGAVVQPRLLSNSTGSLATLKVKKLDISDAGVYLCSARGSDPILLIQNITVDVLTPPIVTKKPVHQVSPNGMTARFECQAQGYPTPEIYWLKDSVNLTTIPRIKTYVKDNNTIELAIASTLPSDSGVYQCVAVNAAGEIWAAGRLQVAMSPQSPLVPTSLDCQSLSSDKIFLSWELPQTIATSIFQLYITVHYAEPDSSREDTIIHEKNSSFIEIRDLQPFTNYTMYIRTWNRHGGSNQSTTVQCSTAASVPIDAPAITVEAMSSTKLNVSWRSLSKKQARGHIIEYKLQRRLPNHPSSKIIMLSSATNQYIITDLNPGTRYEIRVLARTKQGWPASDLQFNWTSVTMPFTDPTQPPSIVNLNAISVNASAIKVKWKINEEVVKPLDDFDSWQLYYQKANGKKLLPIFLPKNCSEYLFTDLEADVSYAIGLCMISSGKSLLCFSKELDSKRLVNDKTLNNLEGIPTSSTSINITWCGDNSDREYYYEVCYNAVLSIDSESLKCFNTSNVTVSIRSLKPFTLYQFRVRLVYNDGEQNSPYSETIECYTNEDDRVNIPPQYSPILQLFKIVPGTVTEVRWVKSNVTEVYVSWDKLSTTNGTISNYTVSYIDGPASTPIKYWKNVTVPGNKTIVNLPGLTPNTRYFVEVRAATSAGYGKPSNRLVIYTPKNSTDLPREEPTDPPAKPVTDDQNLGIIVGVSISICFIMVCLSSIYCRKKWENSQLPGENPQSLKDRVILRNGNGYCIERNLGSATQHVSTVAVTNDIELTALCPSSPKAADFHGCRSNGIIESHAKEPLLTSWDTTNGDSKDLNITENPQYERRSSSDSTRQPEQELDATKLTTLSYTLDNSDSGSNNNFEPSESLSSLRVSATSVPVVGPNGKS